MKASHITLACAAALALASPTFAADPTPKSDPMKSDSVEAPHMYQFLAQNASGETGSVSLKAAGADSTVVTVALKGAPADPQPAHIHLGTCAKLDPKPAYPLTPVVNGASTTTVNVSLAKLTTGGYAVNVHKSAAEAATYVSCASLLMTRDPMKMASPSPSP